MHVVCASARVVTQVDAIVLDLVGLLLVELLASKDFTSGLLDLSQSADAL